MDGIFELRIDKIAALGEGLGAIKGKKAFVPFTAPGDLVKARIVKEYKDYVRAEIVEIVDASPDRVKPSCPLYGACGGCSLQHMRDDAQREARMEIFEEALGRAGLAAESLPRIEMKSGSPYGYRSRFRFIGTGGGAGLMKSESEEPVLLHDCPVAAQPVRDFLVEAGTPPGEAVPDGLRVQVYGGAEGLFLEGRDETARERIASRTIRFRTAGFFQSNAEMLGILASDILGLAPGGRIADLYGGCGTFSAFLAEKAERTVLVESDSASAALAKENAGAATSLDVAAMRVEDWIGTGAQRARLDAALMDPPRGGLSPSVRSWLSSSGPATLMYVSCDAVTLSRDIAALAAGGYRIEGLTAYDFYPQTARLECLALLSRAA